MAILKDTLIQGACRVIGDAYFNAIKSGVWNGTAVAVEYGGTGATTASAARTNLGIGSVGTLNYGSDTTKYLRNDGNWLVPPNTTYKFTIGSTTKGDSTNGVDLGTLKSESASSGGTTLSLVTTGEKATWNAKTSNAGTVTKVSTGTGLTGGDITSTGTISINSTYQTYISHGESAYNSLGNYLPLAGGTMSNTNVVTNLNADLLDGINSTDFLRKVTVKNNEANDFNSFSSMTLTGRGDPTTGASLSNAPWSGAGPAGGYGTLTYLWSGYGIQLAFGYGSYRTYIRYKYYTNNAASWVGTWDSFALSSDLSSYYNKTTSDGRYVYKAGDTMTGALTVPSISVTGAATFSLAINGSILGNAATASRLLNPRTIWGLSFDGTANITGDFVGSGDITLANVKHLNFKDSGGTARNIVLLNASNHVILGYGMTSNSSSRTELHSGAGGIKLMVAGTNVANVNYGSGTNDLKGIFPGTDNTYTLGTTNKKWYSVVASNLYGTLSGKVSYASNGMWIKGRDNATVINSSEAGSDTFIPVAGSYSYDGFWCMGTLGNTNNLYFEFTSNTNYNTENNNSSYRVSLRPPSNLNANAVEDVAYLSDLGSYLKTDGTVTATGMINLLASLYTEAVTLANTTAALSLGNSNIKGVNGIYFSDTSNEMNEGIHFIRSSSNTSCYVDTLLAYNGDLYYRKYRKLGDTKSEYPSINTTGCHVVLHTGNSSVNTTNRTVSINGTSITVPPTSEFDSVSPLYIDNDNDSTNNSSSCSQLNISSKVGGYQLTKSGYSTLYRQTSSYSITTIFARDLFFNISSNYLLLLIPYASIPLGVYNIYLNKGIIFRFVYGNGRGYPRSLTVHYLVPSNTAGGITTTTFTLSSSTAIQRINFISSDCWFNGTPLIYPDNSSDAYAVSLNFSTAKCRMWRMFVLSNGEGSGTSSTPAEICIYPVYCY